MRNVTAYAVVAGLVLPAATPAQVESVSAAARRLAGRNCRVRGFRRSKNERY